jgi:hypothetical protein
MLDVRRMLGVLKTRAVLKTCAVLKRSDAGSRRGHRRHPTAGHPRHHPEEARRHRPAARRFRDIQDRAALNFIKRLPRLGGRACATRVVVVVVILFSTSAV